MIKGKDVLVRIKHSKTGEEGWTTLEDIGVAIFKSIQEVENETKLKEDKK